MSAAFVGQKPVESTAPRTLRGAYDHQGFVYAKSKNIEGTYWNEVGYLPDGTPMNAAGNSMNHPERMGPDTHKAGSALPTSYYTNSVGYLPDGTPLNMAGNAMNHPERAGADLHKAGSPLPEPYKGYVNSVGYLPDGTPMNKAGNLYYHNK